MITISFYDQQATNDGYFLTSSSGVEKAIFFPIHKEDP